MPIFAILEHLPVTTTSNLAESLLRELSNINPNPDRSTTNLAKSPLRELGTAEQAHVVLIYVGKGRQICGVRRS